MSSPKIADIARTRNENSKMACIVSLETSFELLNAILEDRYAGFGIWEAFRLGDYRTVFNEGLITLKEENELLIASRIMEMIGLAYYRNGDYQASLDIIDQVILVNQVHPIVLVTQAECIGRLGRTVLACDLLLQLSENELLTPEEQMFTAGSLSLLGERTLAMRIAAEATARDPYQAANLISLSYYTYQVHGLVQSVEALANRAVQLEPDSMIFRIWLTKILIALERPSDAFALVSRASKEQIESVSCICCISQLCLLYERFGDLEHVNFCLEALKQRSHQTNINQASGD